MAVQAQAPTEALAALDYGKARIRRALFCGLQGRCVGVLLAVEQLAADRLSVANHQNRLQLTAKAIMPLGREPGEKAAVAPVVAYPPGHERL